MESHALLSGKELYGDLKEAWEEIIQYIQRFMSADVILISTPMWNFSIPYMLKQYIDVIVQPKYLFKYTKTGVDGLAKGKKLIVVSSRGGDYSSQESKGMDFQEPYLRAVFGFVGITDITFIKAEPLDMGAEMCRRRNSEKQNQQQKNLQNGCNQCLEIYPLEMEKS